MPRLPAASIDSGNFAVANSLTSVSASSTGYCLPGAILVFQACSRLGMALMSEALHVDAHTARTASDRAHRGLEAGGGQIRLLDLGDLLELRTRNPTHFGCVGCTTAFFNTDGLANQHRRRRGLHDEGEAAVRVHR